MALKSKEWFLGKCLSEVGSHSRLSPMSWTALKKGIGGTDGTRGHIGQAVGVSQRFLEQFPQHIATIQAADPTLSFDIASHMAVQNDLRTWLNAQAGQYGRASFKFNYDSFKKNTTATVGGTRVGGGGGDDEFKRVLRLMAEFV